MGFLPENFINNQLLNSVPHVFDYYTSRLF